MDSEYHWEIYELAALKPFGWCWRSRSSAFVDKQGSIMYSDMHEAIDDAIAHGMDPRRQRCDIVRADGSRVPYRASARKAAG